MWIEGFFDVAIVAPKLVQLVSNFFLVRRDVIAEPRSTINHDTT
jgi:hypothetical protein